jgi:hypothetical protein
LGTCPGLDFGLVIGYWWGRGREKKKDVYLYQSSILMAELRMAEDEKSFQRSDALEHHTIK